MANHLVSNGTEFNAVLPPHGSIAKEMQALLWRSQVVTAFHLVPAAEFVNLDHKMESDVVACGDDDDARHTLMEIIAGIPDLRAFDGGSLENAVGMETFAAVLLTINIRHKVQGRPAALGHLMALPRSTTPRGARSSRSRPDGLVRMYVCGITPYDSTHLGHAATYLTYDLLIRRLEELGHEVHMVRNVTDVDDSILPKARELGVPYLELAEPEIARFRADMDALEMRPPIAEPRATETIDEIISMVERLLDSGHAYLTHGTAYFDVSTAPSFGELSHYSEDQMVRLARARGGNPDDPHRRDPLDFVLWQPSRADEPAWRAPFGVGRPGLARRVLGDVDAGARPDARPARRRHRPDLPAPRVRDRAERGGHRRAVRAPLAALGDGRLRGREDEQVARQPRVHQRPAARPPTRARSGSRCMHHHYRCGFEWHDTDIQDGTALLHRLVAAAASARRSRSRAVRGAGARRDRRRPRRAPRARRARRARRRDPLRRHRPDAPVVLRELAALLGVDLTMPAD